MPSFHQSENLVIIPARGGSKGIPHKNIQLLDGIPLIAWNIKVALASSYINRVVVSTDDSAVAKISSEYGAEIIWRPAELSTDTATSESAILHVLETLKSNENYQPDLVVFMQCTSPLTNTEDIDNCIIKLISEEADTATTVTDFHYFIWKKNEEGVGEGINHDKSFRPRRQDREPQFLETGAVYVMKTEGFLRHKNRFFGKTVLSKMPAERVHEIDEPLDLQVAELKIRKQLQKRKMDLLPEIIKAVVFDFDGVMTDNKVYITEKGVESVRCDRGDGMGIDLLKSKGYHVVVLSTESNPVVSARCKKLNLEYFQNLGLSKYETLEKWCMENKIEQSQLIFMGNDMNDIDCLKFSGCSVVPADAHSSVFPYAKIILNNNGGDGAVRELCDLILIKFN